MYSKWVINEEASPGHTFSLFYIPILWPSSLSKSVLFHHSQNNPLTFSSRLEAIKEWFAFVQNERDHVTIINNQVNLQNYCQWSVRTTYLNKQLACELETQQNSDSLTLQLAIFHHRKFDRCLLISCTCIFKFKFVS